MRRFMRFLFVAGMSSVYLMQAPCSYTEHGFSILPSIGGTFTGLTGLVT